MAISRYVPVFSIAAYGSTFADCRVTQAANVLVDDRHHCVISDFGQSEMKTEAYRISGIPLPRTCDYIGCFSAC